jgi:hypothetical protein
MPGSSARAPYCQLRKDRRKPMTNFEQGISNIERSETAARFCQNFSISKFLVRYSLFSFISKNMAAAAKAHQTVKSLAVTRRIRGHRSRASH